MEDHPKDVSRDLENISIIFGDESLPHLYENSRVSSDQLPGQPGNCFFLSLDHVLISCYICFNVIFLKKVL